MSVKLAGKLPTGDRDGLQAAEDDLRTARLPVVAVVWLYPRSVADVLDNQADPYLVTLGVKAVEVLHGDGQQVGLDLLASEYERRVGRLPLWDEDERL